MAEEGLNQKMNLTECETYTVMKAQLTISLIVLSSLALSSVLTVNAAKPPNIEEGGHRVPAFVYWPGHIKAGSSSSVTCSPSNPRASSGLSLGLAYANSYQ